MMDWIALAAFAAVNLLAASSGAVFAPGAWYERLAKPGWTPPNWAFPVVWSIVFALIAYAGWLFWLEAGFERGGVGLALYGLNLILNAAWSAIFFGLKRPDWAFAEVILLWASIVAVIVAFAPLSRSRPPFCCPISRG